MTHEKHAETQKIQKSQKKTTKQIRLAKKQRWKYFDPIEI